LNLEPKGAVVGIVSVYFGGNRLLAVDGHVLLSIAIEEGLKPVDEDIGFDPARGSNGFLTA
jgi:hypothetical protein